MRRAGRAGAVLAIAGLLGGCGLVRTAVDRDLRYPGGVGGAVFDRYGPYAAAPSKQLQLFREVVTLAVVSRVATANISDGKESDALIEYMKAATKEIDYAAIHLYDEHGAPCAEFQNLSADPKARPPELSATDSTPSPPPAATMLNDCRSALFESELPNVERALLNVAFAGLPKQDAVKLWRSARSGDALGAIWRAAQLAAHSIDGAHRAAAVHRSGVELIPVIAANPNWFATERAASTAQPAQVPGESATITAALCFLGYQDPGGISCASAGAPLGTDLSRRNGRRLDRAAYQTLASLNIPPGAFDSVFEMVQVSCRLLPISANDIKTTNPADDRRTTCKQLKFAPISRLKDPPPPPATPTAGAG